MKNNFKTNQAGFTLVELIIVVAIIAVLATVLAPQYLQYVERSRESNDLQVAAQLMDAAQIAISDPNNDVPSGIIYEIAWSTNGQHSYDGSVLVRSPRVPSPLAPVPSAYTDSRGAAAVDEAISKIMGADTTTTPNPSSYVDLYHGSIPDGQSSIAGKVDFIFHINTSTGEIALANESKKWASEMGLNIRYNP